ncbi:hypothetical protein H4R35_000112 [Dimargaris xerosporica]|nr:hypothetical protein H4R35_000112 [Dimargaris xerosporica]
MSRPPSQDAFHTTRRSPAQSMVHSSDTIPIDSLAQKYQKLFDEYTRIKAHHAVLKQAVLKTQQRNEQLVIDLDAKQDEGARLSHQVDTLQFNNTRLTKRLEDLQRALVQQKRSSGWFTSTTSQRDLSSAREALEVISGELEAKINENEQLHSDITDIQAACQRKTDSLRAEIQRLDQEKLQFQDQLQHSEDNERPRLKQYQRKVSELTTSVQELTANQTTLKDALAATEADLRLTRSQFEFRQAFVRHGMHWVGILVGNQAEKFPNTAPGFAEALAQRFTATLETLKQAWATFKAEIIRHQAHLQPELARAHIPLMDKCVDRLANSTHTLSDLDRTALLDDATAFLTWHLNLILDTKRHNDFYQDLFKQLRTCTARFDRSPHDPRVLPYFVFQELQAIIAGKVVNVSASPCQTLMALVNALVQVCAWKLYSWNGADPLNSALGDSTPAIDIFSVQSWPKDVMTLQRLYDQSTHAYHTLRARHRETTQAMHALEMGQATLRAEIDQLQQTLADAQRKHQSAEKFANQKQAKLTQTIQQLYADIDAKSQQISTLEKQITSHRSTAEDLKGALQAHIDQFEQERTHQNSEISRLQSETESYKQQLLHLQSSSEETEQRIAQQQQQEFDTRQASLIQTHKTRVSELTQVITSLQAQVADLTQTLEQQRHASQPIPAKKDLSPKLQEAKPAPVKGVPDSTMQVLSENDDMEFNYEAAKHLLDASCEKPPTVVDTNATDQTLHAAAETEARGTTTESPRLSEPIILNGQVPAIPAPSAPTDAETNGTADTAPALDQADRAYLAREQQLIDYYEEKIAKLKVQVEIADSKAVKFHKAWDLANRQMDMAGRDKHALEQQINRLNTRILELEDELNTTQRSYMQQIEIMTESNDKA